METLHSTEFSVPSFPVINFVAVELVCEFSYKLAFPSISTGIYHFPVELAAKIAVCTVARFLDENEDKFDLVEWVLFDENTEKTYEAEVDRLYEEMK